eukprot:9222459-Pyramimonas_sp.AAC.1
MGAIAAPLTVYGSANSRMLSQAPLRGSLRANPSVRVAGAPIAFLGSRMLTRPVVHRRVGSSRRSVVVAARKKVVAPVEVAEDADVPPPPP